MNKRLTFRLINEKINFKSYLFLKFFQQICYYPIKIFLKFFFSHRVEGLEKIKHLHNKPVIFACNHISFLDPIIGGASLSINFMPIRFIAAKEYFYTFKNNPFPFPLSILVALYVRLNGSIPVDREDKNSSLDMKLKSVIECIRQEYKIWIFPEGKVSKSGELLKFKRGVVYLHQATKIPIIPVVILGSNEIFKLRNILRFIFGFKKLKVKFGEPIYNLGEVSLEEGTEIVRKKVKELY